MHTIDELPPDQRAVLQLVLVNRRSYEEIAGLLSLDPAAVRERARAATAELAGSAGDGALTDYLLGQASEPAAAAARSRLSAPGPERDWALAVRSQLERLSPGSAPEIPVGAPLGADATAPPEPGPPTAPPEPGPPTAPPEPGPPTVSPEPEPPTVPPGPAPDPATVPSSSRRGGAILLGVAGTAVLAAIVVVLIVLLSGSSGSRAGSHQPAVGSAPTPARTSTTGTSASAAGPKLLAALNLTSPNGSSKTVGVAQVIREGGVTGIVIDAQGVPPNTAHDAYGVWLYNSATSTSFVGFVPKRVGQNGRLQTEGKLPAGAGSYSRLLITLETTAKPTKPGQVVLSGPFNERS